MFKEDYGFVVEKVLLDHDKQPQTQINHYIGKFIFDHDKLNTNTLNIIYYAGHGWSQGAEGLNLAG